MRGISVLIRSVFMMIIDGQAGTHMHDSVPEGVYQVGLGEHLVGSPKRDRAGVEK